MSPARRREAVVRIQERFGLSERRACRAVGQHRASQRHQPRRRDADEPIRRRLREISATDPRFGYRRAWAVLQRDGVTVNRKRVQRLWRAEGLRVPAQRLKRRRVGNSTVPADRLVATHRNHVWALDFLFDATSDGRPIKALSMCDEYTRECIGGRVARSITADDVADVLDDVAAHRGRPENIRCDNGPEFVAGAIRDWCRFSETGAAFIEPGSPWQNAYVESFQRAGARRTLESRDLRHGAGGASAVPRLAPSLQPSPPAQRARVDDTGCVRRCGARENGGGDAMMQRAHQVHETRAILRGRRRPERPRHDLRHLAHARVCRYHPSRSGQVPSCCVLSMRAPSR